MSDFILILIDRTLTNNTIQCTPEKMVRKQFGTLRTMIPMQPQVRPYRHEGGHSPVHIKFPSFSRSFMLCLWTPQHYQ